MTGLLRAARYGTLGLVCALATCWSLRQASEATNDYTAAGEKSMRDYTALLDQPLPSFKHPLLQIDDWHYPDYFLARGEEEAFANVAKLRQWRAGAYFKAGTVDFAALREKFAVADMILRRRAVDCGRVECVALTFDDGPSVYTSGILDVLAEYQGKATFYVLGQLIQHHPETMTRMRDEGHEIANHTWSHPNLRTISDARIVEEMTRAEAEIKKYTGVKTTNMRPRRPRDRAATHRAENGTRDGRRDTRRARHGSGQGVRAWRWAEDGAGVGVRLTAQSSPARVKPELLTAPIRFATCSR